MTSRLAEITSAADLSGVIPDDAELQQWLMSPKSAAEAGASPDSKLKEMLRNAFTFVEPPNAMICTICKDPFVEPVETDCGHVFCGGCITTWLTSHSKESCPLCSQSLTIEACRPVNRVLSSIIDDLPVRCNSCSEVTKRSAIATHVKDHCKSSPFRQLTETAWGSPLPSNPPSKGVLTTHNAQGMLGNPRTLKLAASSVSSASSGADAAGWATPEPKAKSRSRSAQLAAVAAASKENLGGWSTQYTPKLGKGHAKSAAAPAAPTLQPGLLFEYHRGTFSRLPNFDGLAPQSCGAAPVVNLDMMAKCDAAPPTAVAAATIGAGANADGIASSSAAGPSVTGQPLDCAIRFSGFVRIVVAGEYTFHVGSNDGSRLRIDNKVITEMDQVQYYKEKAGTIALEKGNHTLELTYFYRSGKMGEGILRQGSGLELKYSLLGNGWMNQGGFGPISIPGEMLFSAKEDAEDARGRIADAASSKVTNMLRDENQQLAQGFDNQSRRVAELDHQIMELKAKKMNAEQRRGDAEQALRTAQIELSTTQRDNHRLQAQVHQLQADILAREEASAVERMRHFNAVALAIKIALCREENTISISNSEMYAMAESERVPSAEWPAYVRSKLLAP